LDLARFIEGQDAGASPRVTATPYHKGDHDGNQSKSAGLSARRLVHSRQAPEKILKIPPYFFPLEFACKDEGTNAFTYVVQNNNQAQALAA
jgi:hypothetical protein